LDESVFEILVQAVKDLVGQLDAAILELVRLAALRRTGSHVELLGETKARANKHLADAMNTLEGMRQWS
jgi:hypothetical protein